MTAEIGLSDDWNFGSQLDLDALFIAQLGVCY